MSNAKEHPIRKSPPPTGKCQRLFETMEQEDTLAILIKADPDSMASAVALKRLLWRKVKKVSIYHVNPIQRADNLAFIKLLKIKQQHIRHMNPANITKWALVDSQPSHDEQFKDLNFDIIIDHHPVESTSRARFLDIRENYGANSTIMTEYLRGAKIKPSEMLATALFLGIKTDTDSFVRGSVDNDVSAFRYLYQYANMNIVKKIESSELNRKMLVYFKIGLDKLIFLKKIAFAHLGEVENPDTLVILADFFLRIAETTWSAVSGINQDKLIVILRNASFRGDAGKTAERLFERWGASAGGHKGAARAEIPLESLLKELKGEWDPGQFVLNNLKELK
jgi:nanoRNase/pAp phosphatase (c-di-AMP/oligoRNAs hydrolase)